MSFGLTELIASVLPGNTWQVEVLQNSVAEYLAALILFLILWVVFWILQKSVLARLEHLAKKSATDLDDTAIAIVTRVRPPFYLSIAAYLALKTLSLTEFMSAVIDGLIIIVLVYQAIMSAKVLIDYALRKRLQAAEGDEDKEENHRNLEAGLNIVNKIATFCLWAIGILFVLSNFGVNVTSLIASLGIGGIAVALAAQNILADLFSSLAIYFDKPFQIGDTIKVDGVTGTVKHIGIKTTRLKSLSGEEVVLSNRKLTDAQVQNFKRLEERRVVAAIGITYETPSEKVERVPALIKSVIDGRDTVRFDRAHFKEFGDSALIFEVVYHVTDRDYTLFMDRQQDINMALFKAFAAEGIEFAYPTQTVFVKK